MLSIKNKAVRSALVGLSMTELETLSALAGTDTLYGVAEFVMAFPNHAPKTLKDDVRGKFAQYVDEHTTILFPRIMNKVLESGRDFLVEDWQKLIHDIFPGVHFYDNTIVYSVIVEGEYKNTDRFKEDTLFSNYRKAHTHFLNKSATQRIKEWDVVEVDDDDQFQAQTNVWESFIDIYLTKRMVH